MTLRARLALGLTLLLALMVLALGAVSVRAAQRVLVGQIDENLLQIASRVPGSGTIADITGGRNPLRQSYALVVLAPGGRLLGSLPSGFEGDPDPLPDTTDVERPEGPPRLTTLPAESGSEEYRALVVAGPRGTTVVLGESLREVETATRRLLRVTVLGGVVILAGGAGITWWTVRRETGAIDEMVAAAGDVAAGELGRRVPGEPTAVELRTLRDALNDMFGRNEAAFETERATQERLRQFVADASHELRTPITAISGYAQLHRMGGLEDANARDAAMSRIEAETERMERLVADLMLLARLDSAHTRESTVVGLADAVGSAVADHLAVADDHPVDIGGVDTDVLADPDALAQVLGNLLANVRAHTPAGTRTTIGARTDDGWVAVAVADDGPGVGDEHLPHLFDRFYQARDPRHRSGPGTGLGLAIVAGLVEAMGGSIAADRGPSGGLRVTVRLPAADNGADDHGDTP